MYLVNTTLHMTIKTMPNAKVYSPQFWLLCTSAFLFFASFNLIIAELPDYLESMGGGDYKGMIISLFTLTAGLSRPFSGKLADKVGRVPVMVFGAVVCFVIGFLYPILTSIAGFLFLRLIHGFSTGFTPTGNSAYLADVVPINRRGEAMGFLGFFNSMGMALGPALGSYIFSVSSYQVMFYCSSAMAILSVLILWGMRETLTKPEPFSIQHLRINKSDIFEKRVLPAAIVTVLSMFSFGAVLTLIPDLSKNLGFSNKGTFFTIFTISSLFVRLTAGKASDKYGRVPVLIVANALLACAMFYTAFVDSMLGLQIAAVLFGLSIGINSPTVFAWTVDRSINEKKGRGLSTVYIALELGIGLGAVVAGYIYGNNLQQISYPFIVAGCLCVLSLMYLIINKIRGKFIY